ncbi:MAG: monovalent cation/H+ antiporter complex subunit F [Acidimicrobiia bacterium]
MAVVVACGIMLVIGAILAAIRIERGPSMLDRMVALDIVTSTLAIGVALESAWNRRVDTVPILAALALVGFMASVTVARFASVEPEDERRIKSIEEVEAEDAARRQAEDEDAQREAAEESR